MNINSDNILVAKTYMYEYKFRAEKHQLDIGIIGRFFEKILGTDFYADLEIDLYGKYHIYWIDAYKILCASNNKHIVYEI